jgi:hypothetical protein
VSSVRQYENGYLGHARKPEKPSLTRMGNHGSEVDLITAQTGKGLNVRRVAERSVVATKRSNARRAKGPYWK